MKMFVAGRLWFVAWNLIGSVFVLFGSYRITLLQVLSARMLVDEPLSVAFHTTIIPCFSLVMSSLIESV